MALQPTRHRFTVDEFYRMAQAGIFAEDDRVELIDGEVYEMSPIGDHPAGCVKRLNHLLTPRLARRAIVSVQDPVRLDAHNELQPDVALLRPRPDFYASGHPTPADVLLLAEVADANAQFDRNVKLPLYARSGVPEVWLVDLARETVTVYRDPSPTRYEHVQVLHRGDRLAPLAFPDLQLDVAEVLG